MTVAQLRKERMLGRERALAERTSETRLADANRDAATNAASTRQAHKIYALEAIPVPVKLSTTPTSHTVKMVPEACPPPRP